MVGIIVRWLRFVIGTVCRVGILVPLLPADTLSSLKATEKRDPYSSLRLLAFANIDTPGEQQKYSVALLEYLFSMLPGDATVVAFYDIACVLDRSTNKVRQKDPIFLVKSNKPFAYH